MIEKAYYFSRIEFLVLLGISDIREIYSFEPPGQDEITKDDVVMALHGLVKRGTVTTGNGMGISPEIWQILKKMAGAKLALTVISRESAFQQIYYMSHSGNVVLETRSDGRELRLAELSDAELRERLIYGDGVSGKLLMTEEEGVRLEQYNALILEEREEILLLEKFYLDKPLLRWLEHKNTRDIWEVMDLEEKVCCQRVIFLEGNLNGWILKQGEGVFEMAYDSLEARQGILDYFMEKGGKHNGHGRYTGSVSWQKI